MCLPDSRSRGLTASPPLRRRSRRARELSGTFCVSVRGVLSTAERAVEGTFRRQEHAPYGRRFWSGGEWSRGCLGVDIRCCPQVGAGGWSGRGVRGVMRRWNHLQHHPCRRIPGPGGTPRWRITMADRFGRLVQTGLRTGMSMKLGTRSRTKWRKVEWTQPRTDQRRRGWSEPRTEARPRGRRRGRTRPPAGPDGSWMNRDRESGDGLREVRRGWWPCCRCRRFSERGTCQRRW